MLANAWRISPRCSPRCALDSNRSRAKRLRLTSDLARSAANSLQRPYTSRRVAFSASACTSDNLRFRRSSAQLSSLGRVNLDCGSLSMGLSPDELDGRDVPLLPFLSAGLAIVLLCCSKRRMPQQRCSCVNELWRVASDGRGRHVTETVGAYALAERSFRQARYPVIYCYRSHG